MTPGERFKGWIDSLAEAWKEQLRGWISGVLEWGIELLLDVIGKAAAPKLTPLIERLEHETTIPPELKPIFDEIKKPTGEIAAIFAQSAGGALVGGAISKVLDYLLRPIVFGLSWSPDFVVLDPVQQITLWLRGKVTDAELEAALRKSGFGTENIAYLKDLVSPRLAPELAIRAQFRGIIDATTMNKQLQDQGWRDEDIKALWEVLHYYPQPADLVRWQAREVFEPEMIARYGLDSEFAAIEKAPFYKAGMTDEQILNYWRAHWEHASWMQVVEMLHRGLLSEEEVWDWFRLVEIPPFWRDKLIKTAYTWPTRVDVRRWWDMRTISEERLEELYKGMGYRDKNLKDYMNWTKVYTDFGMMMTRFTNGWIAEADIRDWLTGLGVPDDRIQQFMEEKIKPEKPARTTTERDLTRADFIKGIKKGVISVAEGKELIMAMGYDAEETDFIIAVHVETEGGSPANFAEYKRLAQLWRYSQGLSTERKPEEIAAAEKELTEKYPKHVPLTEEELKIKVDTIRRKRRARQLTRDEEIVGLLELGLKVELATAYADNDDLRLRAETGGK